MKTLLIACSSALLLSACTPPIKVGAPPPPAAWLVCKPAPARPSLPGLTPIGEHYAKEQVDRRDKAIAEYILDLRAAHFDCKLQLSKVSDYHEAAE
jgi:hypothetical protein